MTNHEILRNCLEVAGTAFGCVFLVLAVFFVLIRILARSGAALRE